MEQFSGCLRRLSERQIRFSSFSVVDLLIYSDHVLLSKCNEADNRRWRLAAAGTSFVRLPILVFLNHRCRSIVLRFVDIWLCVSMQNAVSFSSSLYRRPTSVVSSLHHLHNLDVFHFRARDWNVPVF